LRGINLSELAGKCMHKTAVERILAYLLLKAWLKKQMLNHSSCRCIKYSPASFSATPFQCKDRESGDLFAIALLRSPSQLLSSCMNVFFIILIYNQFLQFIRI